MMLRKLEGKVALVTGSGRGIGRAIALKLAAEGAKIVVNDLDSEPAEETVQVIRDLGGEAVACIGSVTDGDFAERFINMAIDNWDDLHIIVNNAGYTWDNVVQKMSDEQFDAMYEVHVKAPFQILRAAAGPIRERAKKEKEAGTLVTRKVVNISSISGTTGNAGQANYSSAKAAVTGLTKAIAKEWGRYNVTSNCVAYGYIETRLTQALGDGEAKIEVEGRSVNVGVQPQALAVMNAMIPLGRGGSPEDAAGAVYLFCIPESDYVTGQVIVCGGGMGSTT